MLGVIVLALATPEPSPTPLKTISHIHASPFCTALRENIGHAVRGLLQNDVVISQGKSIFLQMAQDAVRSGSASMVIDVDMVKLDRVIGGMVQNLAATDAALNDLRHIPNQPKTQDERDLVDMRNQLRAVADRQREALNVFSGTYYGYSSNELLGKGNPVASSIAPETAGGAAPANADSDGGGPPIVIPPIKAPSSTPVPASRVSPSPSPSSDPKHVAVVDMGLVGFTPFAGLFNSLTTVQVLEEPLESQAAKTILRRTDECR